MPGTPIPISVKSPLGVRRKDIMGVVVNKAALYAGLHHMPMSLDLGV